MVVSMMIYMQNKCMQKKERKRLTWIFFDNVATKIQEVSNNNNNNKSDWGVSDLLFDTPILSWEQICACDDFMN